MTFNELSEKLRTKFGDAAAPPAEGAPQAVTVPGPAIEEVARFCKEDPALDLNVLSCLAGVDRKDKIELVYHLLSYRKGHELVLKAALDRAKPEISTVETVWKTANWHERECFDLLGVNFLGHSDLRRILLPDDWAGYPLRKDYVAPTEYHGMSSARVNPLQQPEAPADGKCSELKDLSQLKTVYGPVAGEMIVNMGPQHPSTHGVLNFLLVTDGEVMHKAVPHIGYLHRGMEKMAESISYPGYMPFTDRLDYLAAMSANQGYAMAVEKLLGCAVPPRGEYLRVLACELNRIASHLVATGSMAMDIGAFTPFLHWLREREFINDIMEELCGSRLTYNYLRIGGVAHDLPEGMADKILRWMDQLRADHRGVRPADLEQRDLRAAAGERGRDQRGRRGGLRPRRAELARQRGGLGPAAQHAVLGVCGLPVRTSRSAKGSAGPPATAIDRFVVRVLEMRESCRIIRQALAKMPAGEIRAKVPKKIKVPPGETYARVEAPRGEMGFYLISDGQETPYRLKVRTGSFTAMSIIEKLSHGVMIADLVAIIGSLDVVAPEVDR